MVWYNLKEKWSKRMVNRSELLDIISTPITHKPQDLTYEIK